MASVRVEGSISRSDERKVAYRISGNLLLGRSIHLTCCVDGHCSAPFQPSDGALCDRGRVCMSSFFPLHACDVVDAVTGAIVSPVPYDYLVGDLSGALMWRGPHNAVVMSSGLASGKGTVHHLKFPDVVRSFRFGVLVVQYGKKEHVLRFDGDAVLDREASGLARVASWMARWLIHTRK